MQTYAPRHYVYKFVSNYDYQGFFKKEANIRQTACFPPFSRIIRLLISDNDENYARELLKMCYTEIEKLKDEYQNQILYLDAMKAPIKKIQNKFRYQILLRTKLDKADEIEEKVFEVANKIVKNNVFLEVNPTNMS